MREGSSLFVVAGSLACGLTASAWGEPLTAPNLAPVRLEAAAGAAPAKAASNRKNGGARPRSSQKRAAFVSKTAVAATLARRRGGKRDDSVNTWPIFGFTEGADVGRKGDRTIFHDNVIRAGGTHVAWDGSIGIGYSVSDSAVVSFGVVPSYERANVPSSAPGGVLSASALGFGVLAGLKYQFVGRDASPVGLAIQLTPFWQRFDGRPNGHDALGTELRLIVDRTVVPELWFAAMNFVYQPQRNTYVDGNVIREATFEISAAISRRLSGDLFVGAEIRHLSKSQSYIFDRQAGSALYLGPTLLFPIGEAGYIGAAWSLKVAGEMQTEGAPGFDLQAFDRHQLRMKAGFSF
jgi:hypothetical protein